MRLKNNQNAYIFPLSDLHVGHINHNREWFKVWEGVFRKTGENKMIYLLGDLVENPTTRISAYDSECSTEDAVDEVIRMLKPYRDYIRAIVTGNHEKRLKKEFNYDLTGTIASALGVPYSGSDFFDRFSVNGTPVTVYGKHGTRYSKSPELAMRNFKNDMADIEADLYLQGHNHFCEFSSKYQRNYQKGHRQYYGFTGHFLNYNGSYAHDKGMLVSPASFMRLEINSDCVINCRKYYADEWADDLWK